MNMQQIEKYCPKNHEKNHEGNQRSQRREALGSHTFQKELKRKEKKMVSGRKKIPAIEGCVN